MDTTNWTKAIGEQIIKSCEFSIGDYKTESINLGKGEYKDIYYYQDKVYKIEYKTNNIITNTIHIDNTKCNECNKKNDKLIYCDYCEEYNCDECNSFKHYSRVRDYYN